MFACLTDLFNAIANQHFWPHEPYPGGRYECNWSFAFPDETTVFVLELVKVDAPGWEFTFSDVADDLASIFQAAQLFIDPVSGMPQMHIEVFRYRNGKDGPTFLASQGGLRYNSPLSANVSVA